jgi:hypothetical protein
MIEVKAFSRSARGEALPLEHRQVVAARANPEHYYLYVVDTLAGLDGAGIGVRILHGDGSGHQQGGAGNLSSLSPFDAASSLVSVAKGSLVSEPSVDRSQEAWLDRAPDQHVAYEVKGPRSCVRRFEGCARNTV